MKAIKPGAEPIFIPGGETGCLVLHGFTSSPQEVRWLGEHLAESGHTVLGVRLAGHGTNVKDMARTRWQDWAASVMDGYRLLSQNCARVILFGFSTGGALALLLGRQLGAVAVMGMGTPFQLPPIPALKVLRPVLRPLSLLLPSIRKGPPSWYDQEALKQRVAYNAYPVRAVHELGELLTIMRVELPSIRHPVHLIHSKQDTFIPPEHMTLLFENIGSADKQMQWVENSSHVITCDAARFEVFEAAQQFAQRFGKA